MSAAPRFSTADIARNAQAREAETAAKSTPAPATPVTPVDESRKDATPGTRRLEIEQIESGPIKNRQMENRQVENQDVEKHPIENRPVEDRPIENRQLAEDSSAPLFATDAADGFRHRWDSIQASFVDDPRHAVEEADALVAETMTRLAETFAQERTRLEEQFEHGTNLSTEDLRMTLRHYRSFFNRLLSV
jgi:hypothetical protein